MIDPRLLRSEPDLVRDSQLRRGTDAGAVDLFLDLDRRHRAAQQDFEALRAEQKRLGKKIGPARGAAKRGALDASQQADLDGWLAEAEVLAAKVKQAEADAAALGPQVAAAAREIDNIVDPAAPVGGEEDFALIEEVGSARDFAAEGFAPRDHLELGRILGAIDTDRGAKVSGARFFYLTGPGALLELALLNLAMSLAVRNGFTPVIPPALVRPETMEGTGFLGQAAENVYRLEADDLYLVGTAEVPLAGLHADEILPADGLPLRYVGFSPCFRREAGSHGKDTRGIIRVHQFDKVEMFVYCDPDEAEAEHRRLLGWEREFLDLLDVPYRVIDVATGDLGASAARKFDIEAWIPTQGRYREVTSTSNCTTFQSRRLNTRSRSADGGPKPLATLNGTLVAMPRIIVAILENHQLPDGSVRIPEALRPFLGGVDRLLPR
jgi:seryl-tRNA synthetase